MICYEHPLNERIRTLLRLEDLFDRVAFFTARDEAIEHHSALVTLFEILDVTSRSDMKSELLQELERQKQSLETMRRSPNISEGALNEVLGSIQAASRSMLGMAGKIGEHMREDEWLMGIRQRVGIPGGACEFDLPSYHYWLHLNPGLRRTDLDGWLAPLLPLREGIDIVLDLLRRSGKTASYVARRGSFQQMAAGRVAHMLCLKVDEKLPCIPEISANKYALNIRFVTSGSRQRTRVYENDVAFDLTFCSL
ncbi:cell division protein ZapD [Nitrosovibrio sp. Nv17]|uniref:cell division protein ZapD n=1 Tax=Nitrosovibrio sp. Nv17 TaxID=1855339 RepID=UPI00090879F3|nr:cell division protein ZapD [Nitrosovibrio sp. Nv17]SFW11443.1 cell division protein ZapD [Nitrosovibrio sp. Nv17]